MLNVHGEAGILNPKACVLEIDHWVGWCELLISPFAPYPMHLIGRSSIVTA